MSVDFHFAHTNAAFDQLMRRIEPGLALPPHNVWGFASRTVAERLAQRIVELAANAFVEQCARRIAAGEPPLPPQDAPVHCGGLHFDSVAGAVRPGIRLIARSSVEFFAHWAIVLWHIVASRNKRAGPDKLAYTVLMGVGAESVECDGSDERFVEYCRNGPVAPLAEARRLIVQSASVRSSSAPDLVQYARFPLIALLQASPAEGLERCKLAVRQIVLALRFVASVFRHPILALLGRDAALVPLVDWLDRQGLLRAVVLTNSAVYRQELWLRETDRRSFRAHMVWYSQNTIPHVFASAGIASNHPGYRHIRADVHWLWTAEFADYLRQLPIPGELRVVGPILWYLPEAVPPRTPDEIRIAVFDVTPVRDEVAPRIGVIGNYYCTDNMVRFIEDLVAVCGALEARAGKRVRLLLKHKRHYHPIHDPRYIELIERLSGVEGRIELVNFQANMYTLLATSDLCVVVPYSSPAYVASRMDKPAILFDASLKIVPTHLPAANVSFVAGREELLVRIIGLLEAAGRFEGPRH